MGNLTRAVITGYGAALPERIMTNADFTKFLDTSDEWITQRTGISERHVVSEGETTASLGTEAATIALKKAKINPLDLDLIICNTVSPEVPLPATACFIQSGIGATDVPALDISAACSGFIYGLDIACAMIESGKYSKILLVGSDALTRLADYTDRGSCILFGDGAGAVVLERESDADRGILYTVVHADGNGWEYINIPAGGSREPLTHEALDQNRTKIKMKGRDVYRFAVEKMQWVLGNCMEQCNLTVDDIDMVIPHQVNTRIITSAAEKFNMPLEKVYINIDRLGNTSGASIPLALSEALNLGVIGPGSTVIFAAFGAGLTWGGAVVKL